MSFTYSHHVYTSTITASNKNVHLITSWWLNQPKSKNMIVKMGSSSPGIGVDIKKKYLSCHHLEKSLDFIYTTYTNCLLGDYISPITYSGNQETTIDHSFPQTQSLRLGRISKVFLKVRPGGSAWIPGIHQRRKHAIHCTPLEGLVILLMFFFLEGWCFMIKTRYKKKGAKDFLVNVTKIQINKQNLLV